MFCLFQYRVRPGEKCGFTTKSTKVTKRIFRNPSRDAGCEDIHAGRRPSAESDHTKPACLGRFSWFRSFCVFVPFVAIPAKIPLPHFANASELISGHCDRVAIISAELNPERCLRIPRTPSMAGNTLIPFDANKFELIHQVGGIPDRHLRLAGCRRRARVPGGDGGHRFRPAFHRCAGSRRRHRGGFLSELQPGPT